MTTTTPPPDIPVEDYFVTISLLDQLYWVAGSTIGALAGVMIPFDTTGVDFALTALFAVLCIEQIKKFINTRKEKCL